MSNYTDCQAGFQSANLQAERIAAVKTATMDQLDDIMVLTEYTEGAVTLGQVAIDHQDLRRAAQNELGRRMSGEVA